MADKTGISWTDATWTPVRDCSRVPGARPCSAEWLRSLRDQCAAAGVEFFLKQATEASAVGEVNRG